MYTSNIPHGNDVSENHQTTDMLNGTGGTESTTDFGHATGKETAGFLWVGASSHGLTVEEDCRSSMGSLYITFFSWFNR